MATYTIDTYHVRLWSSRPTTDLNPDIAVAGIFLYEGGFEGDQFRGYAYFYPDGTRKSPRSSMTSTARSTCTTTCRSSRRSCSCCARSSPSTCTSTRVCFPDHRWLVPIRR
jgi:hypothetical protein